ncbi:uncharacterized protein BDR25DRAFT_307167 [Lindgomyces ingoldianus]|uniref:Uncharacterized protein n=1 Tax=Lindgomyces ingoldianus TaxID=673940 RepID=A0ACB6QCN4_9PLEO|nr:uncharacterized protein BDR25DRAFT_307167 [Lindgomyces ingoldianus]KAF2464666.1 hypothetical protein BDR25DRAFT_307167 [Lindgomyces ingoldianus]
MFCLRSWIPILFFLLRTNASPVYLVLFISATYFLNRPCVYCSLLLFILVVALFDFHTPWFEPPLESESLEGVINGTSPLRDVIGETASLVVSAANSTAQAAVKAAINGLKDKMSVGSQISGGMAEAGGQSYEWVKGLLGKKEWRISCLDVLFRI